MTIRPRSAATNRGLKSPFASQPEHWGWRDALGPVFVWLLVLAIVLFVEPLAGLLVWVVGLVGR